MAETVRLKVQVREGRGSQEARRLRRQGLLPGVIYGHKEAVVAVALPRDQFEAAVRHGARTVDLETNDKTERALIQEVQWDHLGQDILHADFRRVSEDERVVLQVQLQLRGVAPGVAAGGALVQPLHALEVECLATAVPDSIRVNIGELQLDGVIHVRDLTLPPGVKAITDPEQIVVQVTAPQAEAETPTGPTAEQAEPEVITRQKPEEEG